MNKKLFVLFIVIIVAGLIVTAVSASDCRVKVSKGRLVDANTIMWTVQIPTPAPGEKGPITYGPITSDIVCYPDGDMCVQMEGASVTVVEGELPAP